MSVALGAFIKQQAVQQVAMKSIQAFFYTGLVGALSIPMLINTAIKSTFGSKWASALRRAQDAGKMLAWLLVQVRRARGPAVRWSNPGQTPVKRPPNGGQTRAGRQRAAGPARLLVCFSARLDPRGGRTNAWTCPHLPAPRPRPAPASRARPPQGCHGDRPVTLIGIGMGARVMFHTLLELDRLADQGAPARGLVENVVLLGAPVSCRPERWAAGEGGCGACAEGAGSACAWLAALSLL
jgi:hypothetical protein